MENRENIEAEIERTRRALDGLDTFELHVLAEHFGLSYATLFHFRSGRYPNPRYRTVRAVQEHFGIRGNAS